MSAQLSLTGGAPAFPKRWASISPCERYRYVLGYRWAAGPLTVFAMCNPSTADAASDDATTRKCTGFAKRWGSGGWLIINPCALRSRHPGALLEAADPVGPQNLSYVLATLPSERVARVVLGWGSAMPKQLLKHCDALVTQLRGLAFEAAAAGQGYELSCLGTTADGQPRHPLMLAYATPLVPWRPPPSKESG